MYCGTAYLSVVYVLVQWYSLPISDVLRYSLSIRYVLRYSVEVKAIESNETLDERQPRTAAKALSKDFEGLHYTNCK